MNTTRALKLEMFYGSLEAWSRLCVDDKLVE